MTLLTKSETLVVIPVYNHMEKLSGVVEKAIKAGWQVLVVDDGSTDGGLATLQSLPCHKVSLPVNEGKGAAILVGVKWAKEKGYSAIITIDADGQLNPDEAELLLAEAQTKWPSVVIGSRRMAEGTAPKSSLFGRKFSNFWVRMECGLELPDTQSGFRLYPVKPLLAVPLRTKRYDFEIEVLVRLAWAGLPIRSVSISVDYPAKGRVSHFHKLKDNFRLTMLHTRLVLRALSPFPHKKTTNQPNTVKDLTSILHPIKLLKRICTEHDSSFQLALAAWMGVFLGSLPLLAVHTVVIVYVTHKLHLNKVAAVAASQLCAPPLLPIFCIQTGYLMRTGDFLTEFSRETLVLQMHQRLWEWFIGSLLVGPLLGVAVALLTYVFVYRIRKGLEAPCDQPEC